MTKQYFANNVSSALLSTSPRPRVTKFKETARDCVRHVINHVAQNLNGNVCEGGSKLGRDTDLKLVSFRDVMNVV